MSSHLIALMKRHRTTWIFVLEKNCEPSVFNIFIIIKQVFLPFLPNTHFCKVSALSMIPSSQRTCIWLPSLSPYRCHKETILTSAFTFLPLLFKLYIPLWKRKLHFYFSNCISCLVSIFLSQILLYLIRCSRRAHRCLIMELKPS